MHSRNENNPYHNTAGNYERHLSLPIISQIRRQEAQAVTDLINRYNKPDGSAVEIGPGTGFYTRLLAQSFREVVAIEDSAEMAKILSANLAEHGNITVFNRDFMTFAPEGKFDIAVAIGVLDYIAQPEEFVRKMCSLAKRAVIITTPHCSFWGKFFVLGGKMQKIKVYCRSRNELRNLAPGWKCNISEVGLKTPVTGGLTLVAVLEPLES